LLSENNSAKHAYQKYAATAFQSDRVKKNHLKVEYGQRDNAAIMQCAQSRSCIAHPSSLYDMRHRPLTQMRRKPAFQSRTDRQPPRLERRGNRRHTEDATSDLVSPLALEDIALLAEAQRSARRSALSLPSASRVFGPTATKAKGGEDEGSD
jgi:hypothetical protein